MGGSLASEAIILLSRVTFQHNVIGILGLDVPWLGVHSHVITSGVTGLVKPNKSEEKIPLDRPTALSPDPSTTSLTTESTFSLPETFNSETASSSQTSLGDTLLPPPTSRSPSPKPKEKKSNFKDTFTKTVTAIYNNRHDLGGAAPRYLWSHLEYGHILLDPAELKAQYDQLRSLPVKFANYYTCIPRSETEGKRGRVFCSLPESVARSMEGWEEVEMPKGMDEPTAHSAIFVPEVFPGYHGMVEDVAKKLASWEK
jgi:hypothetical protein